MIFDFHTHVFPDAMAAATIHKLSLMSRTLPFADGTIGGLTNSMAQSAVDYSITLPVMTKPQQVEKLNSGFIRDREQLLSQGIIAFGGMHPDYPDYKAELRRLRANHIPGIKLHPAYQGVPFDDIRYLRIIDCASEEGLIVLTHAGIDIGIYDQNYCTTKQVLHVIDEVHPDRLVLAHMGGWGCWDAVERDLAGAPVWFDTAFSIGPLTPNPACDEPPILTMNLNDEDFVRLCRKHGTNRILFATDSPWADQADYIQRIRQMDFTDIEKEQIFSQNALALLNSTAA